MTLEPAPRRVRASRLDARAGARRHVTVWLRVPQRRPGRPGVGAHHPGRRAALRRRRRRPHDGPRDVVARRHRRPQPRHQLPLPARRRAQPATASSTAPGSTPAPWPTAPTSACRRTRRRPRGSPTRIFYQVFPDRFARSGAARPVAGVGRRRRVGRPGRPPTGRRAVRQVYGGDLPGVEARLDHLASLGAGGLYLTPFFPAPSSHRYNADTFDHVDPLLGGDDALARLVKACHNRGIRVIGDLTINHVGARARVVPRRPGRSRDRPRPGSSSSATTPTTTRRGSTSRACPSSTCATRSCDAG